MNDLYEVLRFQTFKRLPDGCPTYGKLVHDVGYLDMLSRLEFAGQNLPFKILIH
jgi:hypothetical protein